MDISIFFYNLTVTKLNLIGFFKGFLSVPGSWLKIKSHCAFTVVPRLWIILLQIFRELESASLKSICFLWAFWTPSGSSGGGGGYV